MVRNIICKSVKEFQLMEKKYGNSSCQSADRILERQGYILYIIDDTLRPDERSIFFCSDDCMDCSTPCRTKEEPKEYANLVIRTDKIKRCLK